MIISHQTTCNQVEGLTGANTSMLTNQAKLYTSVNQSIAYDNDSVSFAGKHRLVSSAGELTLGA